MEVIDYGNHIAIPTAEQQKYYREHSDQFEQAKVRGIYVAFTSGQVKSDVKARTEAEAKPRIEDLRKQLMDAADSAKLAKETAKDKEAAEIGAEWSTIHP